VINGILWRLKTGAPWRDIPARYGPHQTCYDRFVRWGRDGTWARILQALQTEADSRGDLDWDSAALDATHIKAHRSAAGARKIPARAEKSNCVVCQAIAGFQELPERIIAFKMHRSFLAQATKATFFGLPLSSKRS
jgi:transposase